jgi:hypothetical protein
MMHLTALINDQVKPESYQDKNGSSDTNLLHHAAENYPVQASVTFIDTHEPAGPLLRISRVNMKVSLKSLDIKASS